MGSIPTPGTSDLYPIKGGELCLKKAGTNKYVVLFSCMQKRSVFLAGSLLAISLLIIPAVVYAQGLVPCLGTDCNLCEGVTLVQLVINAAIGIAFFLAAVLFTYAGALFLTSTGNPSQIQKGRDVFKSVGIGFVLVLCGWLVVDTFMHILIINPNSSYFQNASWNSVGQCSDARPMSYSVSAWLFGAFTSGIGPSPGNIPLYSNGGDGCDAGIVSQSASQAGYTLTSAQSDALACISQGEDGCGSGPVVNQLCWNAACPGNANGSASTAAGAYQVLLEGHSNCYNNSVCEAYAGQAGVPLNCASGFTANGFINNDAASQATVSKCVAAAGYIPCAAAAAACVVTQNPTFSDWATQAANSCKTTYGV